MSLITDQSAPLATTVGVSAGVTISPSVISAILAALMSLLTGCIPVAKATGYVANPRLLAKLMVRRIGLQHAPEVDPQIMEAAVFDAAQQLTAQQWVTAYAEAKAATPPTV